MQTTLLKYREEIRKNPVWSIALSRILLALAFAIAAQTLEPFENTPEIITTAGAYVLAVVALLVLVPLRTLRQKRIRASTLILDITAISFIVVYTGGFHSTWFLLYLFPILSAARYLGRGWTVIIGGIAAAAYGLAAGVLVRSETWEHWILRTAILLAVAYTAAGVKRQRDRAELALLKSIERTQKLILSDAHPNDVLASILDSAMSATGSDMSAIELIEGEATIERYATRADVDDAPEVSEIVRRHYQLVVTSQRPLALPRKRFSSGGNDADRWPGRLVPLMYRGDVFGVLGVFSRRPLHYTREITEKLEWVAILVAMAMKNKRSERIDLLYAIGGQLRESHTLEQIFESFVERTAAHLVCEEAALFLVNDAENAVEKVAVSGPEQETKKARMAVTETYKKGESLTGAVFERKEPTVDNHLTDEIALIPELGKHLPSAKAQHYLGVPLIIGKEIVGVIRLFNKKDAFYSLATPKAERDGFNDEDLKLLTVIATQIASAVRNAKFIARKRHLEDLLQFSPDPIIVIDVEGLISDFNPACERIWGIDADEAIGKEVARFYRSMDDALEVSRLMRESHEHSIYNHDTWIRDVHKQDIPISLSATILYNDGGERIGSIGIFKDQREVLALHEEKLLNEKLAVSGKIAKSTAHELKNDLGRVRGEAEMILFADDSSPSSVEAAGGIVRAIQKAIEKINAILRLASPQAPSGRELLSVSAFLRDFVRRSTREAMGVRVRLHASLPDAPLMVSADEEQLLEVFSNLFANSLAAIRERGSAELIPPGTIEVGARAENGMVQIYWRDDGCGMNEDVAANAFSAFYTTKQYGTGLGLFQTRRILQQHDGDISIARVKDGAEFHIALPLVQEKIGDQR